ncbi:hypothetical protein AB0C34_18430 [Nocardia sp. NPDC049220]|uniref:DUF7373 family lipoprotein n=1 Tax=Nocardia sp. NPDC049220 TaxID=3155273 RepID=UPI00340416C2
MKSFRTAATALACVLSTVLLAACGSTKSGTAQPGEIDIRNLDTGNYPTEPPDAHDDDYQPLFIDMPKVAAMRLADYVATAYDIDPAMKYGRSSSTITTGILPEQLGRITDMKPIAERNRMMYGFESNGSDQNITVADADWPTKQQSNSTTVSTLIMQFPDATRARQAATEFHDTDFGTYRDKNEPVTLPKYPDARAHWRPGSPFLRAVLPHGSYVAAFLVSTVGPDRDALVTLAERAYDTQLPLLDQLAPLSEEAMLRLPWDSDHLLSRALNPNKTKSPSYDNRHALFSLRGILQYAPDREYAKKRFTAMNAEKFAVSDSTLVIRTPGPEAARSVAEQRVTPTPASGAADPPPGLTDATCVENKARYFDTKRFTCIVPYQQYVAFVVADQLLDAQQRAAAQYSVFANSR